MDIKFHIRCESVEGIEVEQRRLYVVISEQDESGRQEGDLWVPVEKLSDLISELQRVVATPVDAVA